MVLPVVSSPSHIKQSTETRMLMLQPFVVSAREINSATRYPVNLESSASQIFPIGEIP